jgi:hypothetical protein
MQQHDSRCQLDICQRMSVCHIAPVWLGDWCGCNCIPFPTLLLENLFRSAWRIDQFRARCTRHSEQVFHAGAATASHLHNRQRRKNGLVVTTGRVQYSAARMLTQKPLLHTQIGRSVNLPDRCEWANPRACLPEPVTIPGGLSRAECSLATVPAQSALLLLATLSCAGWVSASIASGCGLRAAYGGSHTCQWLPRVQQSDQAVYMAALKPRYGAHCRRFRCSHSYPRQRTRLTHGPAWLDGNSRYSSIAAGLSACWRHVPPGTPGAPGTAVGGTTTASSVA